MTSAAKSAGMTLKLRLAVGAAILGAGTVLTSLVLYFGLSEVAERLETALASETRMARYSSLSTQASTFLVIATESVQTNQPAALRAERILPVAEQMRATFDRLHADVEQAVLAVQALGLDAQSRYGTQSLGLARMQATLETTLEGLTQTPGDPAALRPYLDTFASRFDALLSEAANTEVILRNDILSGIDTLRQRLTAIALAISLATILAVAAFHFGLIQPQFRRLDDLRRTAHQIGQGDFAVHLPITRSDEIGQLAAETNRMAAALLARQEDVEAEWAQLNETIAERTEALREANASLAEIDSKRRRFFADISHELRTPLTVILMEAQIGRKGGPDPEEAFAVIEARAMRLNRRIDDLLRLARSDTGELALDPRPVALSDLIDAALSEVRAEIDAAGMRLEVPISADAQILCDANWARQVIVNLIRNAVRHAREGGLLRLRPMVEDAMAGVDLIDNGPGIPPQEQARIFKRFVRGTGATSGDGFGMGLALVRWVLEAQGGHITLVSPVERQAATGEAPGTKIAVRLPCIPD